MGQSDQLTQKASCFVKFDAFQCARETTVKHGRHTERIPKVSAKFISLPTLLPFLQSEKLPLLRVVEFLKPLELNKRKGALVRVSEIHC